MELSGFLNNIALILENNVGSQLTEGDYHLGTVDLEPVSEIQPLNQKYEALLIRCKNCGKSTAFLSLGRLDHYIDTEKESVLQCRHCQFETRVPKVQSIRESQGKEYNFLQLQDKHCIKIISKKGRLIHISALERKIQFEYLEDGTKKTLQIDVPQNKLELIKNIQILQSCRLKIKVFETKSLDPRNALQKKPRQIAEPFISYYYELITISKLKR